MSVLLLSGGLDSAVCLAIEKPDVALFVDYGQPNRPHEAVHAMGLAQRYGVVLRTARITFPWITNPSDPTMLVPGRNLILSSLAAAIGAPVVMGCNADDYEDYPDCRPEFFDALRPIVDVRTPLITMTKQVVGGLARMEGLQHETWSCYYPNDGEPCGKCGACQGRERALA